jgi:hypothetical protein
MDNNAKDQTNQQKDENMSEKAIQDQTEQTEQVNPEATQAKGADIDALDGAADQPKTEEKKEDSKTEGVIKLISDIPKAVWQNGIQPTYEFFKDGATRVWSTMKDAYDAELDHYKEVGPVKYGMNRLAGLGFKVIKLAIATTVFIMLNQYVVTATGVSLFSPTALAIVFAVGVVLVLCKSYMDQKDAGGEGYSASQAGVDVVSAIYSA